MANSQIAKQTKNQLEWDESSVGLKSLANLGYVKKTNYFFRFLICVLIIMIAIVYETERSGAERNKTKYEMVKRGSKHNL